MYMCLCNYKNVMLITNFTKNKLKDSSLKILIRVWSNRHIEMIVVERKKWFLENIKVENSEYNL